MNPGPLCARQTPYQLDRCSGPQLDSNSQTWLCAGALSGSPSSQQAFPVLCTVSPVSLVRWYGSLASRDTGNLCQLGRPLAAQLTVLSVMDFCSAVPISVPSVPVLSFLPPPVFLAQEPYVFPPACLSLPGHCGHCLSVSCWAGMSGHGGVIKGAPVGPRDISREPLLDCLCQGLAQWPHGGRCPLGGDEAWRASSSWCLSKVCKLRGLGAPPVSIITFFLLSVPTMGSIGCDILIK